MHYKIFFILFFLTTLNSFAGKYESDLKKLSKLNSFIDNSGNAYQIDQINNPENTILILYSHGSQGDNKSDKCMKSWTKTPPVLTQLHNAKINNLEIKIYTLCSGVRGWSQVEQDKMVDDFNKIGKLSLKFKDKDGLLLIDKQKQILKQKVILEKVREFEMLGFKNIILAGHSAGGWSSIALYSYYPEIVKGAIAFNPAFAGKLVTNKDEFWSAVRIREIEKMKLSNSSNILVYGHNQDAYETPDTLTFLSRLDNIKLVDLSSTLCEGEMMTGGDHGIPLNKCFAVQEKKDRNISNYLLEIF
jgi:predicted esterase|tara:strand:+ start:897 stop:1802 length:906 start_codon:yes stop_codon:yes gene_type:complete